MPVASTIPGTLSAARRWGRAFMPDIHSHAALHGSAFLSSPTPARQPDAAAGDGDKREPTVEESRLRQQAIGYRLRRIFDDVVSEPVPDEFLDILKQADTKSGSGR